MSMFFSQQLFKIGDENPARLYGSRLLTGLGKVRQKLARPPAKVAAILRGNAQQLADDRDRQRIGEISDQIHLALRRSRVEQSVSDLLHARRQTLNSPRRKGPRHQSAQAGMV